MVLSIVTVHTSYNDLLMARLACLIFCNKTVLSLTKSQQNTKDDNVSFNSALFTMMLTSDPTTKLDDIQHMGGWLIFLRTFARNVLCCGCR